MTFLTASTIPLPYGQPWVRPEEARRLNLPSETLSSFPNSILSNKGPNSTRAVFWLVSNCNSVSRREEAVAELAKHIPVDIVGQCAKNESLRNACGPSSGTGLGGPDCLELFNSHPFFVAAENSLCRDYITEKYWARYNLASVPIVMRRDIYEGHLPEGSFIAMSDFAGPRGIP
jgi:Glycosyltransferase family 10 (fucosyltransferase) C-term